MEAKLTELVQRLKTAAGTNLTTVVLYGSAVTGEFLSEHSDLNVLCVLAQAGARELAQLHVVAEWWMRQGNPAPLVFTLDELRRSADVFAIELFDMKENHRILFGSDFLHGLPGFPPLAPAPGGARAAHELGLLAAGGSSPRLSSPKFIWAS